MTEDADQLAGAMRTYLRERLASSPSLRRVAVELARFVLLEVERIERAAGGADKRESTLEAGDAVPGGDSITRPDESRSEPESTSGQSTEPQTASERERVALQIGDARVELDVDGIAHDERGSRGIVGQLPPKSPTRGHSEVAESHAGATGATADTPREIDLALVSIRSQLKAESCRLFIERRAAHLDHDREREVLPRMHAMIDRAKALPDCFLWVFWPHRAQPTDSRLRTIAAAYDAHASAADLCAMFDEDDTEFTSEETTEAMQWLAEASSALRQVVRWTWMAEDDIDQDQSHKWLRRETSVRRIFVARHMAVDDPADPGRAEEVLEGSRALVAKIKRRRAAAKSVDALLSRVRYHARRIGDGGEGTSHDFQRINEAIAGIVELGVPYSDLRLRAIRREIPVTAFPEDMPPHPALMYVDTPPKSGEDDGDAGSEEESIAWSPRVDRVRAMLDGGGIVIIGGDPRRRAIQRIEDAFTPSTVEWVDLAEHGPSEPMRAPIARQGTKLVVILVKLCGHLHVDEARSFARECGKPFVMLPAGYNPEQIAAQVLDQTSDRLPSESIAD